MMQHETAARALGAIQDGYRLWPVCELCERFNRTIPQALNHGTEDALTAVFSDWQSLRRHSPVKLDLPELRPGV